MVESIITNENSRTIHGVTLELLRHPFRTLILNWNWKAAIISSVLRAPIFFGVYLAQKQGLKMAFAAMAVQFVFRAITGGTNGAIIQSFSKIEPAWHAVVTIPVVLTVVMHIAEWFLQVGFDKIAGTNGKTTAVLLSVLGSVISAGFNLFAMRRGILLVKDESQQSFWHDIKQMPWIVFELVAFPLVWTLKRSKRRNGFDEAAFEEPVVSQTA
ncbi:MAG: hypothetical protein DMF62_15190 [Acidobacteria bacterium]|nr:MAG: hypothetical protein DMF62_15190 [Acidobacteriota bacterium]